MVVGNLGRLPSRNSNGEMLAGTARETASTKKAASGAAPHEHSKETGYLEISYFLGGFCFLKPVSTAAPMLASMSFAGCA